MHILAPDETQPLTSTSYAAALVSSKGPPSWLLTRNCQPTGSLKAFNPSSLTKCCIWAMPVPLLATSKVLWVLHVPSVLQPKSKPAMFTPAKATMPELLPGGELPGEVEGLPDVAGVVPVGEVAPFPYVGGAEALLTTDVVVLLAEAGPAQFAAGRAKAVPTAPSTNRYFISLGVKKYGQEAKARREQSSTEACQDGRPA